MGDIAIRAEKLGKRYRLGQREPYKTLRDVVTDAFTAPFRRGRNQNRSGLQSAIRDLKSDHIWALQDVSFEIKQGDVVGIIGRNGAGKTTLLKILSRTTEPTEGYAEIYGRVGSLLEVGTGFHPELTGRENIYLNAAILGMKRREIDRRFDEIVDFAEVEKFLDTPVKHYSSGMYVRLAFAVAAHLEPEILLVDEVLSVGDAAFQKKCLGKMGEVAKEGRTILFVSHNMAAIEALCESAYLLDQGCLIMNDKTTQVVHRYLSSFELLGGHLLGQRADRQGNGRLRFTDIIFCQINGSRAKAVQCGQDLEISVSYRSDEDNLKRVTMSIGVYALTGQCMLILNNEMVGTEFDLVPSRGQFSCLLKRLPLTPGQYYLNLYCTVNGVIADWVQRATYLMVEAGDFFGTGRLPPQTHGGILVAQDWRVKNMEEERPVG